MLTFDQITEQQPTCGTLTLDYDRRTRSRQKVELDNGEPAGLFLSRGSILAQGQRLLAQSGEVVEIRAARETVSTVSVDDELLMARACYHLGNRHVPLQITAGFIRYQHDHVLDAMVIGLGLNVAVEEAAFEPEAGAYDSGGQHHSHHAHSHHDH